MPSEERTPISTLFPYTTLFRSRIEVCRRCYVVRDVCSVVEHAGRELHTVAAMRLSTRFITSRANIVIERSEEHTSELQSRGQIVCRLLLEKKKTTCACFLPGTV